MSAASADRLLSVARSQIGYVEARGNRTKYGAWYGLDGAAWCAMFTSWCFDQVGMPRDGITYSAWTPGIFRAAEKAGRWSRGNPRPGDLVLFAFSRPSSSRPFGISHVGIVQGLRGRGILTIEGNTDSRGSRTGGRVMEKHRQANIVGYARPAYTGVSPSLKLGDRILRLSDPHMSGPDVLEWQRNLLRWDQVTGRAPKPPLRPAGNFLTLTRAATIAFQADVGIKQDGVVGPVTLAAASAWRDGVPASALQAAAAPPPPRYKVALAYRDDAPVDEGIALTTGSELHLAVLPLSRAGEAERLYLVGAAAGADLPPSVVETKVIAGAGRRQTAEQAAALRRRYDEAGRPQLRELL